MQMFLTSSVTAYLCDATMQMFLTSSGKRGRGMGPHICLTFSGIVKDPNSPGFSRRMHGPLSGASTDAVNDTASPFSSTLASFFKLFRRGTMPFVS